MIVAALVVGVVVAGALLLRRRQGGPPQRVQVDGAKPWAGPARLNGAARVRLPAALPRGPELLLERRAPARGARKVRPPVFVLTLGAVAAAWLAVGAWLGSR